MEHQFPEIRQFLPFQGRLLFLGFRRLLCLPQVTAIFIRCLSEKPHFPFQRRDLRFQILHRICLLRILQLCIQPASTDLRKRTALPSGFPQNTHGIDQRMQIPLASDTKAVQFHQGREKPLLISWHDTARDPVYDLRQIDPFLILRVILIPIHVPHPVPVFQLRRLDPFWQSHLGRSMADLSTLRIHMIPDPRNIITERCLDPRQGVHCHGQHTSAGQVQPGNIRSAVQKIQVREADLIGILYCKSPPDLRCLLTESLGKPAFRLHGKLPQVFPETVFLLFYFLFPLIQSRFFQKHLPDGLRCVRSPG